MVDGGFNHGFGCFGGVRMKALVLAVLVLLLSACTSSTGGSGSPPQLTCEQQFDRDLERGVSYTVALGNYTQCLLDRGDTVGLGVRGR